MENYNSIINKLATRYMFSSLRKQPEKVIAKWIASIAVKKWPRKFSKTWDYDNLRKVKDIASEVNILDLDSIEINIEATRDVEDKSAGYWLLTNGLELIFKLPKNWPKSKVYHRVYALAMHELEHVRQSNKGGGESYFGDDVFKYVTSPDEIEAHLIQFKILMLKEHKDLETVIRDHWKLLFEGKQNELEKAIEIYKKAYLKKYGKF